MFLLLVLSAIPIIALTVAWGVEWKMNSDFRAVILEQRPEAAEVISHVTVSDFCSKAEYRADATELCSASDDISHMKMGAIIAIIFAFALLAGIKTAAILARRSRILLVLFFLPGLYITMIGLAALVILYAILAMGAIYYGESTFFGSIHTGIIFSLGLGAAIGVLYLIVALFSTIRKAKTIVLGKRLKREQHPRIWELVDALATKMNAKPPEVIVAGLEPNFYVTEANVVCLDGKHKGRTMYISLPLCRITSIEELRAILAHELAHYKGRDTLFSQWFYPIYRGITGALNNFSSHFSNGTDGTNQSGATAAALVPAYIVLMYFLDTFAETENEISRDREATADNEAARVASAEDLAVALVKLHVFSSTWYMLRQAMGKLIGESGKTLINASSYFADDVKKKIERREVLKMIPEDGPIHPTDTHPPLSQRLQNLNVTLKNIEKTDFAVSEKKSALSLLTNPSELEEELTNYESAKIMMEIEQHKKNMQIKKKS